MEIECDNSQKMVSEGSFGFGFVDSCSYSNSAENKDQNIKEDKKVESFKGKGNKGKQNKITLFMNSKKRGIDQISNNKQIDQIPNDKSDKAQNIKLIDIGDDSSSDNDLVQEGAIVF